MIDNNYIDTIIQLPSNIFFQTPIATAIMVLKKNKNDNNVLFIDASNEFIKNPDKMKNGKNSNKLSNDNIQNIVDQFKNRTSKEYKSYLASYEEIKENNYNISVNTYLNTNTSIKTIDINKVNKKLSEVIPRQQQIRDELEEIIKELEVGYHD